MRVLLVNAFHYLRGGVERTYLDESRWLTAAGHDVIHFATRDPRNLPSPTERFFAPPADFGEGAAASRQLEQLPRAIWSAPAARAIEALLAEHRPDVAHLHAPSRYLTPSILPPLARARVPVVMTLHDFKPWCTNRILFAHGAPCERCRGGRHWHAFATACVQESRAKSAIGTIEAYAHQALDVYRSVERWIAPSAFVMAKAVEHGVPADRLRPLAHGVERPAVAGATNGVAGASEPFVLYAGRLSVEKGVRQLPAIAMRVAPVPLLVVGDGPLAAWLAGAAATQPNLRLLGRIPDVSLAALRRAAGAVIVPSLFYEHFCYAAAEALAEARPVIAARIGAIPELVEHEATGLLVPPGDPHAIAEAVRRAMTDPAAKSWGEAGRAHVASLADPARHVAGLVAVYREVTEQS
ncbi:MAG: glycosyltransferase family 4 protein [Candidatus Eisenbacteria bacterium]|uniref:Glycosyltransferase family 4 protein n=1 Tax=Eiseniibacteriota bacterium TaxID=2212470 RepID=A0A9D6LA42_UNCEI|nr:glycosyltransferase family 4 protein [Candidatus Eisenbacteria bacterium]MBI3538814.1 glycosyltransferase family 4 protein [Candidatus Eisenbacteria bacterium]